MGFGLILVGLFFSALVFDFGGSEDDDHLTDDSIEGTDGDDILDGLATNDIINGNLGNDTINGNDGDDILRGQGGDDTLNGDNGLDILHGGAGADVLNGGSGNDELFGANIYNRALTTADLIALRNGAIGSELTPPLYLNETNDDSGQDILNSGDGDDFIMLGATDTATDGEGTIHL